MSYEESPYLVELFDFQILHMELNTPLYMLVLVLAVMFLMHKLLFRPVIRTLENREQLQASLREAASNRRKEIELLTQDYERNLARVRAEVAQVRQESHREAQEAVGAILEEARREARAEFDSAMDELRREVEQARAGLEQASRQLAEQAANRILRA